MELFKLFGTIAVNTGDAEKSIDSVSQKASKLGESLQNVGSKVTGAGKTLSAGLTVPLTALGTAAVKTSANFEDGMLKVQSLTGASDADFKKLTKTAKHFGETTAWSASDVADAMGYMALAGFDTNEIIESTSGMLSLASASGEDLATVTDILTDSMTAFGDSASDADRYADVLATTQAKSNTTVGLLGESFKYVAPLAGSYGYKLEDVSTALGMMANAGVKGSMSGTALSSIITRLGTNTSGARDAIEALGVSFYNQDGTARNLSDVLVDMCDATKGMTVEQKASFASTVAGAEAQKGLLAILNQGSGAYRDLQSQITSCDGAASDMADNMESGLGGSIRSLKSAIEGVMITVGEKLAPYIKKAADKIKEFCAWFQSLDSATQDNIVRIGLLVAAIGPLLIVVGKVITFAGKVVGSFQTIATGVGTLMQVGGKLSGGITKVVGLGGKFVTAISAVNPVVLIVIAAITALVAIGVALYKNWDSIKEHAGKVWNGIKTKLTSVVSKIETSVTDSFTKLKDNVIERVNGIKTSASNTWNGIKSSVTTAAKNIKTSVTNAFTGLKNNVSSIFKGIKSVAKSVWNGVKSAITKPVEAAKDTVKKMIDKIKGFFKFDWSLPKLKLPHFKIDGSFSLNPPSVPHFAIDWYKKAMDDPMLMTQPTAFGINKNGQIMAGGEAGSEVVSGTDKLMQLISAAVASQNARLEDIVQKILDFMVQYMPQMANMQLVMDSGAIVGELAPGMDSALGKMAKRRERGVKS